MQNDSKSLVIIVIKSFQQVKMIYSLDNDETRYQEINQEKKVKYFFKVHSGSIGWTYRTGDSDERQ